MRYLKKLKLFAVVYLLVKLVRFVLIHQCNGILTLIYRVLNKTGKLTNNLFKCYY